LDHRVIGRAPVDALIGCLDWQWMVGTGQGLVGLMDGLEGSGAIDPAVEETVSRPEMVEALFRQVARHTPHLITAPSFLPHMFCLSVLTLVHMYWTLRELPWLCS
jgi:hypothetical protein